MEENSANRTAPNFGKSLRSLLPVWLGTWLCCGLAILYFYSLLNGIEYPFESRFQQAVVALRIALIATIISSGAASLIIRRNVRVRTAMWLTAFANQAMLTVFAVIGLQLATSQTETAVLNWAFPSTFFAEYNWLTFILEVAPATSVSAFALVYLSWKLSASRKVA